MYLLRARRRYLTELSLVRFFPLTMLTRKSLFFSEILHEDKTFPQHELAALVASKVYYHLGSFEDSLTYALGAGHLFDVTTNSEYVQTTIGTDLLVLKSIKFVFLHIL